MLIGMNLRQASYYDTALKFADNWPITPFWRQLGGAPDKVALGLDPAGALTPGFDFRKSNYADAPYTALFDDGSNRYAPGTHVFTFDGDATLSFPGSVQVNPNRFEFTAAPDADGKMPASILIKILRNNAANPFKNAHLWAPGLEGAKDSWASSYVARQAGLCAIRFMETSCTNNNPVVDWADRTLPSDPYWNGGFAGLHGLTGIPYEVQIDLCNQTGCTYWMNIPFHANDDFASSYFGLLQSKLNPDIKVVVEYSNEVWNTGFQQGRDAFTTFAPSPDPHTQGFGCTNWYPWRSEQLFRLAEGVFGPTSPRLTRWLGAQPGQPGQLAFVAGQAKIYAARTGPGTIAFDALGAACYFGGGIPAHTGTTITETLDSYFAKLNTAVTVTGPAAWKAAATAAASYNVPLIAYEGGLALQAAFGDVNYTADGNFYIRVARDQRMFGIYRGFLTAIARSYQAACLFDDIAPHTVSAGCWGHQEYEYPIDATFTNAPKMRAVKLRGMFGS